MPSEQSRGMTWADVGALAERLPGVVPSTSYGTPALKVAGKVIARLKEGGDAVVLRAPMVVRDHLLATAPDAYFVTDHYRDYPIVLLRLDRADAAQVGELLESAWRAVAPKRLVDERDTRA
jgi:hypothetical protein